MATGIIRVERRHLEALGRQINGLLTMNRIAKDRMSAIEKRCSALEQATLELAEQLRRVSPEGLGSLPSPSGDDSRIAP